MIGRRPADDSRLDVVVAVSLKYLCDFGDLLICF